MKLIWLSGLCLLLLPATSEAESVAIVGGAVHTAGPARTIDGATILVEDGVIVGVGRDLAIPADVRIIDAHGQRVTPGLMHGASILGLSDVLLADMSNRHSGKGAFGTVSFSVAPGLSRGTVAVADNRRQGLTRAVAMPSANGDMFWGTGVVIVLDEAKDWLQSEGPLVVRIGDAASPGVAWHNLEAALASAAARKPVPPAGSSLSENDMAVLVSVLRRERKLALLVDGQDDIRRAIGLRQRFAIEPVIVGGAEAWRVAGELKETGIAVVLDPQKQLPERFDTIGSTYENAARLDAAGVPFAIASRGLFEQLYNAAGLTQLAGIAVAHGLAWESALRSISAVPAAIFGIDDRYGTIEVGKDADIVVWDGDPLEVTSNALHVFIRGVEQPLTSRRTDLRDHYLAGRARKASGAE